MIGWLFVAGSIGYVGIRTAITYRQKESLSDLLHNHRCSPPQDYTSHAWEQDGASPLLVESQSLGEKEKGTDQTLAERKAEANHFLTTSTTAMGLSVAGRIFFPPLSLLSVPAMLYSWYPLVRYGYDGLKERKVNVGIVDALLVAGLVVTGNFVLASLTVWTLMIAERILVSTEGDSHAKLVNLFGEQPQFVWVRKDGVDVEIPFESLQIGDIVVVGAGETVPVDGRIVEGIATVDQRMLTGESQPVEKNEEDQVYASTIVLSGQFGLEVEKAGEETVAAQIGQILDQTADFRASVRSRGRKVADDYAITTLVIAGVAWPLLGISSAVAALVASFGYNLRVISPISVLNFLQVTSQNGVLIKDGRSLELLKQVDAVVFDKTGTLTIEQPHVGEIHLFHDELSGEKLSKKELLTYTAAAEYRQTHPIAKAILAEAEQRGLTLPNIDEAAYEIGYGIKVKIDGKLVRVGSLRFMHLEQIPIAPEMEAIQESCHDQGYSLVYVAINQSLCGAIELRPTVRPEVESLISTLKERGVALYIISGDHEKPTRKMAQDLDIDHYFAEVLPEGKAEIVAQLQEEGRFVCFIGDGINDSIALKKANVSISMSGATTVATDTAQIILMDGELTQMGFLFNVADSYEKNMQQNWFTTMVPAVVCVGGIFFLHFHVLAGVILYNIGLTAGVANAMSPLLRYSSEREQSRELTKVVG